MLRVSALAAFFAAGGSAGAVAEPTLPPGVLAFVHEDTGAEDPLQQVSNLRLLDVRQPARQVALTSFAIPPTLVEQPGWSPDFETLVFASNAFNGLQSLEEESVYAVDGADGSGLRPLTGFGWVEPLPGPTGSVVGRVVAPTLRIEGRSVPPVVGPCVVSAQGTIELASCETDGRFRLRGVPKDAAWVRAQAVVDYFDAVLGLFGGPGLSVGFTTVDVRAGRTVDAGDVEIRPAIEKSIDPGFSPDGSTLLVSARVRAMVLQQSLDTFEWAWVPTRGGTLAFWDLAGVAGPTTLVLPGPADVADLAGGDWSPVTGRIACAANGTIGGESGSFVMTVEPDGSDPQLVYEAPFDPFDPAVRIVLQARWSPDGQRLAVVEGATSVFDPAVGRSDLIVMDADGSDVRALTRSAWGTFADEPSWSPGGEAIAYHVALVPSLLTNRVLEVDLHAASAAGGEAVRLTTDGGSSQPAWRPGELPVPEPARALLLAAGCGALAAASQAGRRRARRGGLRSGA